MVIDAGGERAPAYEHSMPARAHLPQIGRVCNLHAQSVLYPVRGALRKAKGGDRDG